MKALEILNNGLNFMKEGISHNQKIKQEVNQVIELYNEAIAELEALENINCDGCKYYLSDNGNYPLEPCGECSRWYSDRWESKQ